MSVPRGYVRRPLEDRFWSKVDKRGADECWPWVGSANEHGYGSIRVDGRLAKAHRVSWLLKHPDATLTPSDHVCHRCDNPPCVNPAHLYVGDYASNTADKLRRGRQSRGEERSKALAGKLPTGDDHWTRRNPEKARESAQAMIHKARTQGPWNKGRDRG